jgi:hypothetical protein
MLALNLGLKRFYMKFCNPWRKGRGVAYPVLAMLPDTTSVFALKSPESETQVQVPSGSLKTATLPSRRSSQQSQRRPRSTDNELIT